MNHQCDVTVTLARLNIMMFVCCRAIKAVRAWRTPVGRAPSALPTLRNDFYMVFSCDPRRKEVELEDGGFIVPRLFNAECDCCILLPYARPLAVILEEAVLNANNDGMRLQRPSQARQLCPCHKCRQPHKSSEGQNIKELTPFRCDAMTNVNKCK